MNLDRHSTILFGVIVLVLMLAFMFGYFASVRGQTVAQRKQEVAQFEDPPISKYEERLLSLDRAAVEDAFHEQIKRLFEVWMKDDTGQPARAAVGAKQARKAYEQAMDAIEKREKLFKEQKR
jgi:hypothetical protein